MASSENSFKRAILSPLEELGLKNGTFFAEKINTMFFPFTVKQFLTTATITVRSCFHFLRCILPYDDNFPRRSETRLWDRKLPHVQISLQNNVSLHRTYFRFTNLIVTRITNQKNWKNSISPESLLATKPLTKEPEDSGYEIALSPTRLHFSARRCFRSPPPIDKLYIPGGGVGGLELWMGTHKGIVSNALSSFVGSPFLQGITSLI